MFRAGASGYLLKDCAFDELMDAIKAVNSKHTYLSREISDVLVREFVSNIDEVTKSLEKYCQHVKKKSFS